MCCFCSGNVFACLCVVEVRERRLAWTYVPLERWEKKLPTLSQELAVT